MKMRILNYGLNATHDSITTLKSISNAVSISDYDAFVFNPNHLQVDSFNPPDLSRRANELADLLLKKDGLVLCTLQPKSVLKGWGDTYSILDPFKASGFVRGAVNAGAGRQIKVLQSAKGASAEFFNVLKGNLYFTAYLDVDFKKIPYEGKAFATDSVGHPIAVEFPVDQGLLTFVPNSTDGTPDRLGAAIVKVAKAHFTGAVDLEIPGWVKNITLPGSDRYEGALTNLRSENERISGEIAKLESERNELLEYNRLLFGYGKAVLEPIVRKSMSLLGFVVLDPETYSGEWDVEVIEKSSGRRALGEVEGSEGVIDVDKYRQLLGYVEDEAVEGRDHKGILIGNGFRLSSPDDPIRQRQFSDHAVRGANKQTFCLLPTTELFKAICAVLESPTDDGLKLKIRESLLNTVGVWAFLRE